MPSAVKKVDTNATSQAELQREASLVCGNQDFAERIIQRHVDALKESFKDLPRENLEMTVRGAGPGGCSCGIALHVLSEELAKLQLEEKQRGAVHEG